MKTKTIARTLITRVKYLFGMVAKKNTIPNNLFLWSNWDWSKYGEEWSNTTEWKNSLVEHVLMPNVPLGARVLEIGPGGGRWTEHLIKRASHLTVVDLTPTCIELCRERFKEYSNIEYFVNDGKSLDFIEDESIDCLWSWDVFVHIAPEDIQAYMKEIERVFRPGAQGLIHHSKKGKRTAGWRSDMTPEKMRTFCDENNLTVTRQFNSWDESRFSIWPGKSSKDCPDIITVFAKLND